MAANFHHKAIFYEKELLFENFSFRNMLGGSGCLARRLRSDVVIFVKF